MKHRILYLSLLAALLPVGALAQSPEDSVSLAVSDSAAAKTVPDSLAAKIAPGTKSKKPKKPSRNLKVFPYYNCVRLGVGDMLFETLIWHNQVAMDYSTATDPTVTPDNPAGDGFPIKTNYRYTPHFSAEYMRRVLPWLSVGFMADFQETMWTRQVHYGANSSARGTVSSTQENFYNLILAPGFRIKYFRRANVEFYGGSFIGLDINGGTERDWKGNTTAVGMGMTYVAFGVEAGVGHWFGFVDLGGTVAMQDFNTIYLMLSQIVKMGVSYRF